jgi:hypothetical protein
MSLPQHPFSQPHTVVRTPAWETNSILVVGSSICPWSAPTSLVAHQALDLSVRSCASDGRKVLFIRAEATKSTRLDIGAQDVHIDMIMGVRELGSEVDLVHIG